MDELDEHARSLVAQAREEMSPSAADRVRIKRAITATIAAGATGVATTASAGAGVKWFIAALAVTAAAGGAITLSVSGTTPGEESKRKAETEVEMAPVQPAAESPEEKPSEPIESSPEPVAQGPRLRRRKKAQATVKPPSEPAPPAGISLSDEVAMLRRARTARRNGESTTALEILKQHQTYFPKSQLRDERLIIELQTRCDLGQAGKAKKIASALLKSNPQSPAVPIIDSSCARTE
ncbi:MAG: hypothetical protein AAF654_12565 [Myxococcota bacterium]